MEQKNNLKKVEPDTPSKKVGYGLYSFKIEALIFLVLFILAFGFNAFAILSSEMELMQIFASIHVPLIIAGVLYLASIMFRALIRYLGLTVHTLREIGKKDDF